MSDTANRAALHAFIEIMGAPAEQYHERRAIEPVAYIEIRDRRGLRELVPRTYELAIVATINPIADQRPHIFGNAALQLDGQVRNAAARIHAIRRDDRPGRANIDAPCTASAMRAVVFGRLIGMGQSVGRQRNIHQDLADKKQRPGIALQQQRVFSAPAVTRFLRQLDLENGRGIRKYAIPVRANLALLCDRPTAASGCA